MLAKPNVDFVRVTAFEWPADGVEHGGAIVWVNQIAPAVRIDLLKFAPREGDPCGVDIVHGVVGPQRPHHAGLGLGQQPITLLAGLEPLAARAQVLFLRSEAAAPTKCHFADPAREKAEDEEQGERDSVARIVEEEPASLDEETRRDQGAEDGCEHSRLPAAPPSGQKNCEKKRAQRTAPAEVTDDVADQGRRARSGDGDDVYQATRGEARHSATINPFFLRNCWIVE